MNLIRYLLRAFAGVAGALLITGCGLSEAVDYFSQEPDAEPVRQVITTGASLGFATSVAMDAIGGKQSSDFARVVQGTGSYPASGLVYIDPPVGMVLPPGVAAGKRIAVAGFWSDSVTAIVSVVFVAQSMKHGGIAFTNVSTFPVVRKDSVYVLTFASEDVNAGTSDTALTLSLSQTEVDAELNRLASRPSIDTSVSVDQDVWVVEVQDNHTPGNPADDTYSVLGAGQHIGLGFAGEDLSGGEILQVVMVKSRLTNGCLLNPTEGWGMIRKYGAPGAGSGERPVFGTSVWQFHGNCDGRANIVVGTGTYTGFTGKKAKLGL